ncbi:MAG: tryptophan synthase subunit alpha [Burkholderiales bacterium]|jgi:tryptophan synthase alpha chain
MSRISTAFERLAREKRKALIPYVTAGDPSPAHTVPLMHALADAGADVIELGVPFSDPMADGPVIQRASERALRHRVGLDSVLGFVAEFRQRNDRTPVVLMGYANPIEALGPQAFVTRAQAAGVDGVLVVDYPPEESAGFAELVRAHGMDLIFLLAPTSTAARIDEVSRLASGYVYYVSLKGVTGAGHIDIAEVAAKLGEIRRRTTLPLGVGFGIRDAASACALARVADAVVIGSKIIQEMDEAGAEGAIARASRFVASIRAALDSVPAAAAKAPA